MELRAMKGLAIFLAIVLFMYAVVSFMYKDYDPENSKVSIESGMKGLVYLMASIYLISVTLF